jgi:hypothetical protein
MAFHKLLLLYVTFQLLGAASDGTGPGACRIGKGAAAMVAAVQMVMLEEHAGHSGGCQHPAGLTGWLIYLVMIYFDISHCCPLRVSGPTRLLATPQFGNAHHSRH